MSWERNATAEIVAEKSTSVWLRKTSRSSWRPGTFETPPGTTDLKVMSYVTAEDVGTSVVGGVVHTSGLAFYGWRRLGMDAVGAAAL